MCSPPRCLGDQLLIKVDSSILQIFLKSCFWTNVNNDKCTQCVKINLLRRCNCETQMYKRILDNMFWVFPSILHHWLPVIDQFCSKYLFLCCFSISNCSRNTLCTNSMWKYSSDTCSFHSRIISCSFEKFYSIYTGVS